MKCPAVNLEHFDKFFMPRKEGKHRNESLTETFRMIFLLYTGVTPPIIV